MMPLVGLCITIKCKWLINHLLTINHSFNGESKKIDISDVWTGHEAINVWKYCSKQQKPVSQVTLKLPTFPKSNTVRAKCFRKKLAIPHVSIGLVCSKCFRVLWRCTEFASECLYFSRWTSPRVLLGTAIIHVRLSQQQHRRFASREQTSKLQHC